ncbi:hypothetical protein A252_08167, partial [Pseudomonas syringae pv. actinidiae ICMP 9855]
LGLSHVVSLRLLRHLARDTFFRGKVSYHTHATWVLLDKWRLSRPARTKPYGFMRCRLLIS